MKTLKFHNQALYSALLVNLLTLLISNGCSRSSMNCLPYTGKVVAQVPCGGTLIQVTNQEVNSTYNDGRQAFTNVLGAIVSDVKIDSTLIALNKVVYFDIRELRPEEAPNCLAIFATPTRRVAITRISNQACSINNP